MGRMTNCTIAVGGRGVNLPVFQSFGQGFVTVETKRRRLRFQKSVVWRCVRGVALGTSSRFPERVVDQLTVYHLFPDVIMAIGAQPRFPGGEQKRGTSAMRGVAHKTIFLKRGMHGRQRW